MSNNLAEKSNERLKWLDAVKGFGIILVIFGHTYGIPAIFELTINSFHMPLFFIIAGFVYNEKKYDNLSFKQVFIKKFKDYLIPYFVFGFTNIILQILWNAVFLRATTTWNDLQKYLFGIFYCYSQKDVMPNCSPIWFLMCLFWASLFLWLISKYFKKWMPLFAVVFIISYTISLLIKVRVIWCLPVALMATSFMIFGFYIKKFDIIHLIEMKGKTVFAIILIISFVGGLVAALFNTLVGMSINKYGILPLFLASSTLISFSVMACFSKLNFLSNDFFAFLGENTLLVIGFNYFMRDFTTEIYYMIPVIRRIKIHWSVSFIITFCGLLFMILIVNYLKRKIKSHYSGGDFKLTKLN